MNKLRKLEEYQQEMYFCARCNSCKGIAQPFIRSHRFSRNCPSYEAGHFHAYSMSGKNAMGLALLRKDIDYSDEMLDAVYRCCMCGACELSCRMMMGEEISGNEILHALRVKCVEDGAILPEHQLIVDNIKKEDNSLGEPKEARGDWAAGLEVKDATKEKVDVLFHAGCRFSYNKDLWSVIRDDVTFLRNGGIDIGICGREEACCGGRAFDLGFMGEMKTYADHMSSRIKSSGAKVLVTHCADCYSTFKFYYPWVGVKLDVEVLHVTQYLDKLIKEKQIKFNNRLPMAVTYHDPCRLGRLGDAYELWAGKWDTWRKFFISEPRKPMWTGKGGVYDAPRNILASIPGVEFMEMERNRENAWCCGAGGGCLEAFPDFAQQTALERISEAKASGAEALVTACPWCERNFRDALEAEGSKFPIYDITELIKKAM